MPCSDRRCECYRATLRRLLLVLRRVFADDVREVPDVRTFARCPRECLTVADCLDDFVRLFRGTDKRKRACFLAVERDEKFVAWFCAVAPDDARIEITRALLWVNSVCFCWRSCFRHSAFQSAIILAVILSSARCSFARCFGSCSRCNASMRPDRVITSGNLTATILASFDRAGSIGFAKIDP